MLGLVDDDEAGALDEVVRERPRRGGVQADEAAAAARGLRDGRERDLELDEHAVVGERLVVGEDDAVVRARRDDDLVLAGVVDDDRGEARRAVRDPHAAHVDPLGRELAPAQLPVRVVPDRAEHAHARAEPRGRDGLVRALAAGDLGEPRAADRLARPRQPLGAQHEVDVDRADHGERRRRVRPAGHPPILRPDQPAGFTATAVTSTSHSGRASAVTTRPVKTG